ncbi:PAS domain-containing sensor histidine kinase [Candidatus Endobugula sertula]|uniref:Sensory histidine kinase/phosphatase NtrB n=1 Tax=Candidatus Endobugula sertula TaxID=62101 RepID=A0A1D2QQB3_9GAMM|nr:PAS domain-containing sensor histidine kinase [Candidatus Endobugula sertula]
MTINTDYHLLLDSLTTAVVLLDSDFQIAHVNTAAESLLQISVQRVIGSRFNQYIYESSVAMHKMQRAFLEKEPYTQRKAIWSLHTSKHMTVDYTVTPLAESQQLLLEIQPLDRLLRISREEALLTSQETTKNLLRGLAHEVKNPLGGIRGAAQLLDRELSNDHLQEYTHIIIAESDRLRNLVDRMLEPRSLSAHQPTNIHKVLERVVSVIKAEAVEDVLLQRILFKRHYDPSIPEVLGDIELLIQAVLNIVRNAVQALIEDKDSTHPQITLGTRIHRHFTINRRHHPLVACISIEDNGPGIPADLIEDIFYPMISGRAEGSGLGLAISQQMITQHDGLIECTSSPGQTVFSIYIPLEIHDD